MTTETATDFSPVRDSYGRCCLQAEFFDTFYKIFISKLTPAMADKFKNTEMESQKKALRAGIANLLSFAEGKVTGKMALERLAKSHDRDHLDIQPQYYQTWLDSLLQTIEQSDSQWSPSLKEGWTAALKQGISYMAARH